MLKFHGPVVLQLREGELFRCHQACLVRVMQGRVWITRRNDPDDHFLEAGQALALRDGAQAIVGAEGVAQVALAAAPSPLRALGLRLTRRRRIGGYRNGARSTHS